MRNRLLPIVFAVLIVALIVAGVIYKGTLQPTPFAPSPSAPEPQATPAAALSPAAAPSPGASASPEAMPSSSASPDLTVDDTGLSRATVTLATTEGVIKFKFYPQDAPETVKRIVQLIQQGFYNGLKWHRVEPNFVIQTGDPLGTGSGGSGQKLKAEFNNRRHVEGTVAMARGGDPDSADSQFYITLGTFPHLDHSYTVFGQVIEGMDVARRIKVGDKVISMSVR
jgi:cyclophilin family peptidyl-prolyl cis-trans isomerase